MRCIARNVVAICSCKMREASQPSFVALVPHLEKVDGDDQAEPVPKGFLVTTNLDLAEWASRQTCDAEVPSLNPAVSN